MLLLTYDEWFDHYKSLVETHQVTYFSKSDLIVEI